MSLRLFTNLKTRKDEQNVEYIHSYVQLGIYQILQDVTFSHF